MTKYINRSQFNGIAGKRPGNPKAVFIHNDASYWDANEWANGQLANHNPESGFANYYISDGVVFRAEDTYNCAWHCGDSYWNTWGLSYEVCDSYGDKDKFLRSEQECFKQVAEDMKFYGLTPNRNTVRLHQEVFPTACPHRSMELHGNDVNKVKDYFISQIKKYMNDEPQKPKTDTYYHSRRAKALVIKNACNIYDGVAFSKAKKLGEAKEGKEYKVVDVWDKGTKSTDISRYKIEYAKGKYGWITGNQYYVSSAYYLDKTYSGKTKIKALKSCNVYDDKDLNRDVGDIKKGEVFTVVENVSSSAGTPRFKLKSGKYVTARKDYWKFV